MALFDKIECRMTFNIKLVNYCFEINAINDIKDFYKDYLCNDNHVFSICTSADEIEFERKKSNETSLKEFGKVINYKDSYLETLVVYRKIVECLIEKNILLIHGSCLGVDGNVYMFTGVSGVGKSTHASLWRKAFGDKVTMINDDKPLVEVKDEVIVYGTPYDGKHHLSNNMSGKLKAVCFIKQAKENSIIELSKIDAYMRILRQTYSQPDEKNTKKTMELLDSLVNKVKFYELSCNMELEAAELAYKTMKGE